MNFYKAIVVPSRSITDGRQPLVCVPLVGRDQAAVLGGLATIIAKRPDVIEWRIDYFSGIADTTQVVSLAQRIRDLAAGIPILLTRRSTREGGEPIALSEERVLALHEAIFASRAIDFVDYELSSDPRHFQQALTAAHAAGVQLIASFHDFQRTPSVEEIVAKFIAAEQAGADIAKVAVMPRTIDDVLTLLNATREGHRRSRLPIIGISMGAYGSLTRLFGWAFGSSMTFAVGDQASAPGQLPIGELRDALAIVQRALSGDPK
ncbi:MAG: type I 3-dehydroquinate dehydratase [Candidatus Accumulibacter sp.]|nr:type I 3-dehydroquinate dehydratase [Accumulibacter sp.]